MQQEKCADYITLERGAVCLNLFYQSRWEDEEEKGKRSIADTLGKGTVSQGTGGPVRRGQNSHNPLSGSRTEATSHCWSSPSWPSLLLQHPILPPHDYLHRVRVTLSPLGHLQPPFSQSPCPSSTVTWATQVNAWLYLMDAVSHGDSDVRRARNPPPTLLLLLV